MVDERHVDEHVVRQQVGDAIGISSQRVVVTLDDVANLRELVDEQDDPPARSRRQSANEPREDGEEFRPIAALILTGVE